LVANGMGVSVVPASMRFLQVPGVAYLGITGHAPLARLAVAHRRGETGPLVRNFLAGCA
ncbi:MAG: LysR substrate-binding domain-containing protein, partial [Pseudomonadota bacterium]|nr:LysR substrate-binding domain-containing protein [Pseudomonadota bacterium]